MVIKAYFGQRVPSVTCAPVCLCHCTLTDFLF